MFDLWFEDGDFLSSEGVEFGLYFGVIDNCNLKRIVLEHLYLAKIKLLRRHRNLRPIRVGTNIQQARLVIIRPHNI